MGKESIKGAPRQFVRAWRVYRKLSQEALAFEMGVTHGLISQIERGLTGLTHDRIERLADALGCTPADLLSGPPAPTSKSPVSTGLPASGDSRLAAQAAGMFALLSPTRQRRILAAIEDAARAEGIEVPPPEYEQEDGKIDN